MKRVVTIKRNADDTITIKVNWEGSRSIEHIDTFGKSKGELFDSVKYALIAARVNLTDVEIMELLQ